MADVSLPKWEYRALDVWWFCKLESKKEREKRQLDREVDWEIVAREAEPDGWGNKGAWLSWDSERRCNTDPLRVLNRLGAAGWELVGVQAAELVAGGQSSGLYHPASRLVLKRRLTGQVDDQG